MISIRKPDAPAVLTTRGVAATKAVCAEYERGNRQFTFRSSIYAHADVRAALRAAQRDKCAFCESKFAHIAYGDVEHYRPKGAVRQSETAEPRIPGYFWLAYEWSNLFLSCQLCNQRFKRECFPLRVQKNRARSHSDDLAREQPLLLNPAESPERHIMFIGEMAAPVRNSRAGKTTIEMLGLNRTELVEERLKRRSILLLLRDTHTALVRKAASDPSAELLALIHKIAQQLADAMSDAAEYASMVRSQSH